MRLKLDGTYLTQNLDSVEIKSLSIMRLKQIDGGGLGTRTVGRNQKPLNYEIETTRNMIVS